MGLLSPILRNGTDGRLTWWCPGCDHALAGQTVPIPPWPVQYADWRDA